MRKVLILASLFALLIVVPAAFAKGDHGHGGGDGEFVPVTLCHWHNHAYQTITVDNQGAYNGHLNHEHDITPAPADGCPTAPPNGDNGGDDGEDLGFFCLTDGQYYENPADCPAPEVTPEPTDDDGGNDEPGTPGRIEISQPQASPEAADQMEFWSNLTLSGVGIAYTNGSGVWYVVQSDHTDVVFSVANGKIDFRNRWNADIGAYEENVTLTRLVLGPNNSDTDTDHYRAFDYAMFQATGQLVFVNVFTSYRDEHCQRQDFASAATCGDSTNWSNGQKWSGGVQVR